MPVSEGGGVAAPAAGHGRQLRVASGEGSSQTSCVFRGLFPPNYSSGAAVIVPAAGGGGLDYRVT